MSKHLWLALILVTVVCVGCTRETLEDTDKGLGWVERVLETGLAVPVLAPLAGGIGVALVATKMLGRGVQTALNKKEDAVAVAKKENVLTRLMSSRKYVVALIAIVILVAAEKYTGINLGGEALVKSVLMLVLAPMAGNALEDAAEKLKVK